MRRLLGLNLLVALLLALRGTAEPVVPCPMHNGSEARHQQQGHAVHHQSAGDQSDAPQGNNVHSCSCPGECGLSGPGFTISKREQLAPVNAGTSHQPIPPEQATVVGAVVLLPPATGPPQRLPA